ncbi:MAG: gliding motility-associated C-terminal domain-containing protein [Saprospiraceae bacterium]
MKQCIGLFTVVLLPFMLWGQVSISLTINDAVISTTCEDGFLGGAPDLLWGVNIENEGWSYYPADGICFTALPNQQFNRTFDCPADLPNRVEVCFKAFENDGIVFSPLSCEIVESCSEIICSNILLPAVGASRTDTLQLPDGLTSSGALYFSIMVDGVNNDRICDAYNLGTMDGAGVLGDRNGIGFNNLCGTNTGDPNPAFDGSISNTFSNDKGVWFTFNSGDSPSGLIAVEAMSDPLNVGDPMVLQMAIYSTTNNRCGGFPRLRAVDVDAENSGFIRALLRCPSPNTNYYVLIDGDARSLETLYGHFGIQVENVDVTEAGNRVCDFEDLGQVPEGGQILSERFSNFCADRVGDPNTSSFTSEKSVWFSFVAPPSGHVRIDGRSDAAYKPLDIQLALFQSSTGQCGGLLSEVASQYDAQTFDESMTVSCLYGGERYFLLVDGGIGFDGLFRLQLEDAGDITPKTVIDTILCAGEGLLVGNELYEISGNYVDTLSLFGGCDSIVFSNVTVLPPLVASVEQTMVAIGEGAPNGIASLSIMGGAGAYSIEWCNGEQTPTATALVGGSTCCVTVSDANGCSVEVCLEVEYTDDIIPQVETDTLACFGDENGVIRFSAANGFPPYSFSWQKSDNSNSGSGNLAADDVIASISGLSAGDYLVTINDPFDDTTFVVSVVQPAQLVIDLLHQENASCFGICDASVEVTVSGGVAPYHYQWRYGETTSLINGLCAQENEPYTLSVTDANGCQATFSTTVTEPLPFIVTARETKAVSCFGGLDGAAEVSVENGTIASLSWSTGNQGTAISGLPAGIYEVTATNTDACEGVASVQITQPDAPLTVDIQVVNPISCTGDSDGILRAITTGPGLSFAYEWNMDSDQALAVDLQTGDYEVMVRNEKGCAASADFFLPEPPPLSASLSKKDLTCLDPPNGGAIFIDQVNGGTPDYAYALNGGGFQTQATFQALEEGIYEVNIQDLAGCELKLPIEVQGPPVLLVDLGSDLTLSLGDSALLTPSSNSQTVVYSWKEGGEIFSQAGEVWVKPLYSKQFTIDAYDTSTFCRASDQVLVQVDKNRKVFIPNAFAPQSVHGNEKLRLYGGVGVVAIKSFRVFTRGGDQVYEQLNFMPNDSDAGWDGTFRGQALNTGIYVYFAEIEFIDGLTEIFRGDVLLNR